MTKTPTRILVVDDENSVRLSLLAFLEDMGYETYTSASAEDALIFLGSNKIDVAVVDIRLPNMDGNALICEVKKKIPEMKFLIHTGSVFYSLPEELIQLGIKREDVLIKPLKDMNILIDSINKVYNRE